MVRTVLVSGSPFSLQPGQAINLYVTDNVCPGFVDLRAGRCQLEEIQVKTTNEFNEQYNIWTSWGHVRRGPGAYITTCFPARF